MKYRAPRRKKKKAKKLKSMNDAMIMARAAMITAQSYAQLVIVASTPTSQFLHPTEKSLKSALILIDTAKSVVTNMNDIKHWSHFVPNYRIR